MMHYESCLFFYYFLLILHLCLVSEKWLRGWKSLGGGGSFLGAKFKQNFIFILLRAAKTMSLFFPMKLSIDFNNNCNLLMAYHLIY